jgi:hypothetical protein
MTDRGATRASRGQRTICLPITPDTYARIIDDPPAFRRTLDAAYREAPELFPVDFARGYQLKDHRMSAKQRIRIRRIALKDGRAYSVRPSFLLPYLTARAADVEAPLFLRKFGVPFWALARVFGRDPMSYYRLECALGRASIVGTTAKVDLPEHLAADEHHQTRDGRKIYVATTVGGGCCLGAEPAAAAGTDDLTAAYGVFRDEARDLDPGYAPATVNTDGWKGTRAAWRALFPAVALLSCFLHGWLKIRDRGKHLGEQFREIGRRVWGAYRAPDRRSFAQRLRRLKEWAEEHLSGVVLETVLDLCAKRPRWSIAYAHPVGHRTSNVVDRVLRQMDGYFEAGQHLHGSEEASRRHCRAWALLWNFAPWHPAVARENEGWRSPAERLNQHRYHDCWLQNLLVSASLGGYRNPLPQKP